jgi:predicted PurR-regulated permease PerM
MITIIFYISFLPKFVEDLKTFNYLGFNLSPIIMNPIPSAQFFSPPEKNFSVLKILQYVILISVILFFGRTLFIPLSFALLISCVLYPACKWLEKKGINKSVAIAIAMGAIIVLIATILYLLFLQVASFSEEWQELRIKLSEAFNRLAFWLASHFNISVEQQHVWLKNLAGSSGTQVIPFLRTTFYSFSVATVLAILIPVFSALILYHRHQFLKALYLFFPENKKTAITEILRDVIHTYYNFIKGMLLVYLIVGILNSTGLAIIGISHPILFGFIASILTFIPYVGLIVASLLPISISWIQFNSVWYPLGVVLVFTIVQYLEANIIFPLVVSSRLKINTLVTILAIIGGGILWGTSGMILFIPFLGILKLIADKTESMKALSIILGTSDGK